MNIGENWTSEERLEVVLKIAHELYGTISHPLSRNEQVAIAERLEFLATASPDFLNDPHNRAQVIGKEVD